GGGGQDAVQKSPFGFASQVEAFENARYGWMAILLTFQSCLGAVACMFILMNGANLWALSVCADVTMGSNAMFIALASARVCMFTFYLSVLLNTILIFLYL